MHQITDLENLKGKTIAYCFDTDDIDNDEIVMRFTDDSFAIFEGGGSYAADAVCGIASKIDQKFNSYTSADNKLLVMLGIKTQAELDLFNDKQAQDAAQIRQQQANARQIDSERFPTLHALGVVE